MSAHFARPHRHEALDRLADRRLLRELAYVDGHWTAGETAASFEVTDPATGARIAYVAALDAARRRKRSMPPRAPSRPGARCCRRSARDPAHWYELIVAAREDLALLMTLEQGKPLQESRGEIDYAASFVEWYAEEAKRLNVESVTSHLPDAEMMVRREPLGVAALVTPWNFPSAMMTRKAAAALAAGCTVVAHPSSETPLSALALAELAERAGLPAGVFNVVTGDAADHRRRAVRGRRASAP